MPIRLYFSLSINCTIHYVPMCACVCTLYSANCLLGEALVNHSIRCIFGRNNFWQIDQVFNYNLMYSQCLDGETLPN